MSKIFTLAIFVALSLHTPLSHSSDSVEITLNFVASEDINPDWNKRPYPLIVRMYELKSADAFKKINFLDLYEQDSSVLGDELIDKQRLRHIEPGESREVVLNINKDTKYIGLFAEFLRYKDSKYKLIFPVKKGFFSENKWKIDIRGNKMMLIENE